MATHAFKRPESTCIAHVLQSLDAELLDRCKCFFGGGAAIALALGEFRQSIGIDFWVSDMEGYRELKERMTSENEFASILKPGMYIEQVRPVRPNQFGVATMLRVDGMPIKFEILLEFQSGLRFDSSSTHICGVRTLDPVDMLATKLAANADRWARDDSFNRDLIDMAMMQPDREILVQALSKVRQTVFYRDSCEPNLCKAITRMQQRDGWLATCLDQLHVTVPEASVRQLISRLDRLRDELLVDDAFEPLTAEHHRAIAKAAPKERGKNPDEDPVCLIQVDRYPQLKMIAWSMPDIREMDPRTALALYERNWRHVDQAAMGAEERALLNRLVAQYGEGVLFV